jgi:hypothetical protein
MKPRIHSTWGRKLAACFAVAVVSTPGIEAQVAEAQVTLVNGSFNTLYNHASTPPLANRPATVAPLAGGAGPAATTGLHPTGSTESGVQIVLTWASIGQPYATGYQFFFGDELQPPATDINNAPLAAGAKYWRAEPVRVGENFEDKVWVTSESQRAFHYSIHAEKVFATRPGEVTIHWVTAQPVTQKDKTGVRQWVRTVKLAVAATTIRKVRTLYWTESPFSGPAVQVPTGAIEDIEPAYSDAYFPARVATEYNNGTSGQLKTLWFDKSGLTRSLRAYNIEGRVLIEYLGPTKSQGSPVRKFLGADVVDVVREAVPVAATIYLGREVEPRDASNRKLPLVSTDPPLVPLVSLGSAGTGSSFLASYTVGENRTVYYAERTTSGPADVVFYWLEKKDAEIFPTAAGAPNLGIEWPKIKNHYRFEWNPDATTYAINTVMSGGSTAATGVAFPLGQLPQLVFQDSVGDQAEGQVDAAAQRFTVTFAGRSENRTLLKFQSGTKFWYQNVQTRVEPASVAEETRLVGERIEPPAGHVAGYIASGRNYDPDSYRNPFSLGMTAAGQGAIIPVNAAPQDNLLRIWWFKQVEAPAGSGFQPFYVPASVSAYRVRYPTETDPNPPSKIVFASNAGSGDLSPAEAAGQLYIKNSPGEIGYNPNEEHALLMKGRVYALRDDLNDVNGADATPYTSEPFVLLRYVSSEDKRPKMRTFKVVREEVFTMPTRDLFGICYGNGQFVAVGGAGTILTSTDGISWNSQSSGTTNNLWAVAWGGEQYVAVGDAGTILQSYDAANWSVRSSGVSAQLINVAWGANRFVIVGHNGTVLTGDGGTSWVRERNIPASTLVGLAWNGTRFVVSAYSGSNYDWGFFYSADGASWTFATMVQNAVLDIVWTGTRFVAARGPNPYMSTDGISWQPMAQLQFAPYSVTAGAGVTVVVGAGGVAARGVGDTWFNSLAAGRDLRRVAWGNGQFVAVGLGGTIVYSPDGGSWRAVPSTRTTVGFNYPIVAGTIVQPPMPLPLLPAPTDANGQVLNREVFEAPVTRDVLPDAVPSSVRDRYLNFTFQDRKGNLWVYRGPHGAGSPTIGMQFWYPMRDDFHVPGENPQPAAGTPLPYLRPIRNGVAVGAAFGGRDKATPLTILYTPRWPDNAAELLVGETLTLPKFGLPDVLRQSSADVFYQQSIALGGSTKASVRLLDPIREKTYPLQAGGLAALPKSIRTTALQGLVYFQNLPPHLQPRFYFDPRRGSSGALVLQGRFIDEIVGEDYLQLNVLSADDIRAIEGLAVAEKQTTRDQWSKAVREMSALVETFVESSTAKGTYVAAASPPKKEARDPIEVTGPDVAVVDYALTATGRGAGWVTMVFGDGKAFTPAEEPVSVQVFRVANRLYSGDLKTILSSNPLDEQVTLRHSGDFAGAPEDYVFDWRYSPGGATTPPVYEIDPTPREPLPYGGLWKVVSLKQDVAAPADRPTTAQYDAVPEVALNPGREIVIHPETNGLRTTHPGTVLRSKDGVTFDAANYSVGVPAKIVLSARLSEGVGFVLYVNEVAALAYRAPERFANATPVAGLVPWLPDVDSQFLVPSGYFRPGSNTIEIALFSAGAVGAKASVNFRLHAYRELDRVAPGGGQSTPWNPANNVNDTDPAKIVLNEAVVGGAPERPLGSPVLVMSDNYVTMRYRPKSKSEQAIKEPFDNVAGAGWSRWTQPVLVEGWVKRVLAQINPFNQRMRDLYNNAVNTDVSMLTQAGTRWEGNVALTLEGVNSVGLIELYETVLNRARAMSIDSNIDDPSVNDALLLAAGYLNDLYTILGNEAFADAANPTIAVDDTATSTEVNTSRFSFEGQVKSVLDEELALLRGRDDFEEPRVGTAPVYNRMFWNYTRGINSGEALYAVNYNIREKSGTPTADGVVDAADAARMFPQGHGDAYGHYLTALKGYYRLLQNRNFTWTPRAEAVNVLGKAVQVDYFDERKFAETAANLARTAKQVVALTYRKAYRDDPASGWAHYRDGAINRNTGGTRRDWGLDEWTVRATQGSYFNWVVGNALLPYRDEDPNHTSLQRIDRNEVPALQDLAVAGDSFQTSIDSANAHLNPLELSPGAIAFDISPTELKSGKSHYEQVHERALRAVLNAKGAFDQAARMTRLLRNQENQIDSSNNSIVDQESAYAAKLIELFGTPYPGSIGAGKTYAQGYTGPDTEEWFVVDRPSDLIATGTAIDVPVKVRRQVPSFTDFDFEAVKEIGDSGPTVETVVVSFTPNQKVKFSDSWPRKGSNLGKRAVTGTLQQAILDSYEAELALRSALQDYQLKTADFERRYALLNEMVKKDDAVEDKSEATKNRINGLNRTKFALEEIKPWIDWKAQTIAAGFRATAEALPTASGVAPDVSSVQRALWNREASEVDNGLTLYGKLHDLTLHSFTLTADELASELSDAVDTLEGDYQSKQLAYEFEVQFREMIRLSSEVAQAAVGFQRSNERVRNLLVEGDGLLAERATFRQRAAALVQGYRTRDLTFRTFRNEALEQYRSLFDLASRYTYLSAKSYDYETGLLGSTAGREVVDAIVASRALGDLSGGVPQATVSTLGDAGLAGTMARLQADWSVAKPRLGINNPDQNGTLFSLRRERFRLVDDPDPKVTDDDQAWRGVLETYRIADLLADAHVAALCRNLRKEDGSAVPGFIIPFSTVIRHGLNFFGLPLAEGDHTYSASNFATKIFSVGLVFRGYEGMDPYQLGATSSPVVIGSSSKALSATPYVYLIPTGTDYMRAPPLGDTAQVRGWSVADQALPLPFNLGATQFSSTQFFNANGTLSEQPWILRKHQAFRPVSDPSFFYGSVPTEFTSSRLIGRSVWNSGWKLVIPAYTLHQDEQLGLKRFIENVRDIELFLRTYSHAGN